MELLNKIKHEMSKCLTTTSISNTDNALNEAMRVNGNFVFENFVSKNYCQELVEIAQKTMEDSPGKVSYESNGSDARIYGIDKIATEFKLANFTDTTDEWAKKFYKTEKLVYFQMLGYIKSTKENLGSGGGWHRDSPYRHQFKFILYLSDVSNKNGPFQYINGSHREENIYKHSKILGESCGKYRFTTNEINTILEECPEFNINTVEGQAGTLLIADVKGLHRGMPLESGERWATTRYYYPGKMPENILKKI